MVEFERCLRLKNKLKGGEELEIKVRESCRVHSACWRGFCAPDLCSAYEAKQRRETCLNACWYCETELCETCKVWRGKPIEGVPACRYAVGCSDFGVRCVECQWCPPKASYFEAKVEHWDINNVPFWNPYTGSPTLWAENPYWDTYRRTAAELTWPYQGSSWQRSEQ